MSMDVNGCQWHRLFNFLSTRWLIKPKSPQPWAVSYSTADMGPRILRTSSLEVAKCPKMPAVQQLNQWLSKKLTPFILVCQNEERSTPAGFHCSTLYNLQIRHALLPWKPCCIVAMKPPSLDGIICPVKMEFAAFLAVQIWSFKSLTLRRHHEKGSLPQVFLQLLLVRPEQPCQQSIAPNKHQDIYSNNTSKATIGFFPPKKKNAVTKSLVQRAPCSTSQEFADAGSDLRVLETWPFTASTLMENSLWYPKFHWWKTRGA